MSDDDDLLDPAETVVFDALRALGCTTGAVDPIDPEDCASVAAESVRALRAAGYRL
jgi:hypothetical protein